MALEAPGRSDGPWPKAAVSERSDGGSPREVRFTDITDLDSNSGSPEWGRPGFVFSARVGARGKDGVVLLEAPFGRLAVRGGEDLAPSTLVRLRVERDGASFFLRLLGGSADRSRAVVRPEAGLAVSEAAFLRSLGLPVDALSQSLLSFARAFGLSYDSSVFRSLRRSVLRSPADREASALAAVAAEAKGVRLSDSALGEYVEAIDVNAGRDHRESGRGRDRDERRSRPSSEYLRAAFEEATTSGDALSFLNALPGNDLSRWIVIPVRLGSQTVEFQAVVRILLLAARDKAAEKVGRWAVDVAAEGRTWFFSAEALDSPSPSMRVSTDPPLGAEAPRVSSALDIALGPFGFNIRVSAQTDESRFGERTAEAYTVLDAEA